jgi:hypothetical protein
VAATPATCNYQSVTETVRRAANIGSSTTSSVNSHTNGGCYGTTTVKTATKGCSLPSDINVQGLPGRDRYCRSNHAAEASRSTGISSLRTKQLNCYTGNPCRDNEWLFTAGKWEVLYPKHMHLFFMIFNQRTAWYCFVSMCTYTED